MLTRALNDLKNPKSKTGSLQIIATFTGTTGSMGFVTGQRYELIVRYVRSRGRFEVKTKDGHLLPEHGGLHEELERLSYPERSLDDRELHQTIFENVHGNGGRKG